MVTDEPIKLQCNVPSLTNLQMWNALLVQGAGSGYRSAPSVYITEGGGSGASATAFINGSITGVGVKSQGSGYTSATTIGFSGGGGSGAKVKVILRGGHIVAIEVTDGGSSYDSPPTVSINANGPGTGADADATMSVTGIRLDTSGSGYTSDPVVTISEPTGPESVRVTAMAYAKRNPNNNTISSIYLAGDMNSPKGLSYLSFCDSSGDELTNIYSTISSDNSNAPILVITQGMMLEKDLVVGGFVDSGQGAIWLNYGLKGRAILSSPPLIQMLASETPYPSSANFPNDPEDGQLFNLTQTCYLEGITYPTGYYIWNGTIGKWMNGLSTAQWQQGINFPNNPQPSQIFILTSLCTLNSITYDPGYYYWNSTTSKWIATSFPGFFTGVYDTLFLFKSDGIMPANLDLGTLNVHNSIFSDISRVLRFTGSSQGNTETSIGMVQFEDTYGNTILDFKGWYNSVGVYEWNWVYSNDGGSTWNLKATLDGNGLFKLPAQGSSGGLQIGWDANLYRSAANTLKTDGNLIVHGNLTVDGSTQMQLPSVLTLTGLTLNGNLTLGDGNAIAPADDYYSSIGTAAKMFHDVYTRNLQMGVAGTNYVTFAVDSSGLVIGFDTSSTTGGIVSQYGTQNPTKTFALGSSTNRWHDIYGTNISAYNLTLNGANAQLSLNGQVGSNGQVLTSAGSGATPTWQNPGWNGGIVTNDITMNAKIQFSVLTLRNDAIENWITNSDSGGEAVNYYGYLGGATKYRNFTIYDGKSNLIAQFVGSTGVFSANGLTTYDDKSLYTYFGRYSSSYPYSYIAPSSCSNGFKFTNPAGSLSTMTLDNSGNLTLAGALYGSSGTLTSETDFAVSHANTIYCNLNSTNGGDTAFNLQRAGTTYGALGYEGTSNRVHLVAYQGADLSFESTGGTIYFTNDFVAKGLININPSSGYPSLNFQVSGSNKMQLGYNGTAASVASCNIDLNLSTGSGGNLVLYPYGAVYLWAGRKLLPQNAGGGMVGDHTGNYFYEVAGYYMYGHTPGSFDVYDDLELVKQWGEPQPTITDNYDKTKQVPPANDPFSILKAKDADGNINTDFYDYGNVGGFALSCAKMLSLKQDECSDLILQLLNRIEALESQLKQNHTPA